MAHIRAGQDRVSYGTIATSALVGNMEGFNHFPIMVDKERLQKKITPANIFYLRCASNKYIPLFPCYPVSSASTTTITMASSTVATEYDPTDTESTESWIADPEVCFYDVSTGKVECNGGSGQVYVSSVASTNITINEGFSADPAANDLLITGGFTDGEIIKDIVFVPESIDLNNYNDEYDLNIEAYTDCTIDYDKLSTEQKLFVVAIMESAITAATASFISKFKIVNR